MHAPQRMQFERAAEVVARQQVAPAVVDQHDVQLAAGPRAVEVRGVRRDRLAGGERASSRRNTPRSAARGMSFSMPMQAMCMRRSETPRSALPSLVQTTKPPVSAMAKFTPVSPASAGRNFSRRCCRAASVRYFGSVAPAGVPSVRVEELADLLPLACGWRAARCGWAARCPSCTIRSPRSVSTTSMPCRSRNGIEVALLGEHRLALHQPGDAAVRGGARGRSRCARRRRAPSAPVRRGRGPCARTARGTRRAARGCGA